MLIGRALSLFASMSFAQQCWAADDAFCKQLVTLMGTRHVPQQQRTLPGFQPCTADEVRLVCIRPEPNPEAALRDLDELSDNIKVCFPNADQSGKAHPSWFEFRNAFITIDFSANSASYFTRINIEDSVAVNKLGISVAKLIDLSYSESPGDLAPLGHAVVNEAVRLYGEQSGQAAQIMSLVAGLYRSSNMFEQACDYFARAVAVWDQSDKVQFARTQLFVGSMRQFDLSDVLNDWGASLEALGRDREAVDVMRRAYRVTAESKGAASGEANLVLKSLAVELEKLHDVEGSDRAMDQAIRSLETAKAPLDRAQMSLLEALLLDAGMRQIELGNDTAALTLLLKAAATETDRLRLIPVDDREAILFGSKSPQAHLMLALYHETRGQFAEAEKVLTAARKLMTDLMGPRSITLCEVLWRSAEFYARRKNIERADAFIRDAVRNSSADKYAYWFELRAQGGTLAGVAGQHTLALKRFTELFPQLNEVKESDDREGAEIDVVKGLALEEAALTDYGKVLAPAQRYLALLDQYHSNPLFEVKLGDREELKVRTALARAQLALRNPELGANLRRATTIATDAKLHQKERGGGLFFKDEDWPLFDLLSTNFESRDREPELAAELGFELAQALLTSRAEKAIFEMALRPDPTRPSGLKLREIQDLRLEREAAVVQLAAARTKSNQVLVELASSRLARIDARLAGAEADVAKLDDHIDNLRAEPVALNLAQKLLLPNEALIFLFAPPKAAEQPPLTVYIWVVTKSEVRWVRSEMGTAALQTEVAALRCGLDRASNWREVKGQANLFARNETCDAVAPKGIAPDGPLPFDVARAHTLYTALFGQVEDLITDKKHLIIVPSGALTQLPFQVLVTAAPEKQPSTFADYGSVAWLAKSNAITVLPAVSSLKALRQNAKVSAAQDPFIGFGNPVLTGNAKCGKTTIPDACPAQAFPAAATATATAAAPMTRPSLVAGTVLSFTRNGPGEVTSVRTLCPLPDTAYELDCVAKSLGAPASSLKLGRDMTKAAVMKAPLARYKVIHFATHGLLADETRRLALAHAEPALVMSPPETPTEDDDGLLTASDIAGLKLDADWVVMSACNTAGGAAQGQGQGAEALSGLARAFFYAGARALLVSHWPVDSYAATMLTSRTFAELRADKTIGRSEAFRRAMLALMRERDPARPWAAHPSIWAPFVVVGEGAASAAK